jgi:hypothetical protein
LVEGIAGDRVAGNACPRATLIETNRPSDVIECLSGRIPPPTTHAHDQHVKKRPPTTHNDSDRTQEAHPRDVRGLRDVTGAGDVWTRRRWARGDVGAQGTRARGGRGRAGTSQVEEAWGHERRRG